MSTHGWGGQTPHAAATGLGLPDSGHGIPKLEHCAEDQASGVQSLMYQRAMI